MKESIIKKCTACFTGHRIEKLDVSEEKVIELLKMEIKKDINDGYDTFITGMARGVDIFAAKVILEEKKLNKNVKLICAIPYQGFETKWNETDKCFYNRIIKQADEVIFVCKHYSRTCFQLRNVFMVDNSSKVIAVYSGKKGGTKNTINYAKSQKIEVVNLLE